MTASIPAPRTQRGQGPMMATARQVASDATMEISLASLEAMFLRLPSASRDPIDGLVDRVGPAAARAVDTLQVAALLEAEGVTDRVARVEYGYGDVFDLADEVYQRLGGRGAAERPVPPAVPGRTSALRDISHGALYLLPSAIFPAVLQVIDLRALVVGLLLAGGLSWVWAAGASWLAYQLLGLGGAGAAARVLSWATCAGLVAAAGLGAAVAAAMHAGPSLVALAVGVMAFQMASTLLVFYRKELWLAVAMVPGAVTGVWFVVAGKPILVVALVAGSVSVAAALAAALVRALRARKEATDRPARRPVRTFLGGNAMTFVSVVAYAAVAATFLLHAQAPYLLNHLDVVLAGVPLFIGMGLVEWRARRFGEQARALLRRVRYPRQFVRRVWLLLAANVAACTLTVAALATGLLLALRQAGIASPAAVAMAAAQAVLAGAYLLTFVVAGHGRYGWLCAALVVATTAHLAAAALLPRLSPLADTTVFLGCAVLLQVLLAAVLAPVVGQVWRYR